MWSDDIDLGQVLAFSWMTWHPIDLLHNLVDFLWPMACPIYLTWKDFRGLPAFLKKEFKLDALTSLSFLKVCKFHQLRATQLI